MPFPSSDKPAVSPLHRAFLPVILCILTLVCYASLFGSDFIEAYDDEVYALNPAIAHGITARAIRWSLTTLTGGNWNPLTWWSHMLDVQLFGMNPAGHHATGLLIHTANALLLYLLFVRMTGMRGRSFFVASLFSLHPLHVESVAWVAERKDVLSTLFGLCALHAYVSYTRALRITHYALLMLLFCLSLMAKPMLVTLPFLLFIIDIWPLGRLHNIPLRGLVGEKLPLLMPAAAVSVLTLFSQKSHGALLALDGNPVSTRIAVALDAYVSYLSKFFVPYELAFFYPSTPVPIRRLFGAALLLCGISAISWRFRRSRPWLPAGWLWFLVTLIPVIGIIRVGLQAYADRYTYLPLVGVCIMVTWGAGELLEKKDERRHVRWTGWAVIVPSALAIALCCILTRMQTSYWRDGFALYSRAIAVTRGNWPAHSNLGSMLIKRERYGEGIAQLQLALRHNPGFEPAQYNLAKAYDRMGDIASARLHYRAAVSLNPDSEDNYVALSRTMRTPGELAASLDVIREGLRHLPASAFLKGDEAFILERMGRTDEAVSSYRKALEFDPGYLQVYPLLGEILARNGRVAELRDLYERLSRIDPREAQRLLQLTSGNPQ